MTKHCACRASLSVLEQVLSHTEKSCISQVATIIDNDRLIIDQLQKESLICVDAYQWDPNPNLLKEKPKHNMASHMADALRYALYSFQTSTTSL